ncbi:hypothetical protein LR48_Vigan08g206800 [Vigna angularis]|uniref:Uncharacterized protein n=1 Tax=Phaseolus angularis TaxID=3914 RepID=A0A0L9V849_PHAAN|nr:hypothetical protein LR48_Vigan08g206800 [Vigna angularis]
MFFYSFIADLKASASTLEKELCSLRMKRDGIVNEMDEKRGAFTTLCLEFQKEIDKKEDCEVRSLLLEKDSLENEIELMDKKNNVLENSVLAFVEEILEDLHSSNSGQQTLSGEAAFHVWIQLPPEDYAASHVGYGH